MMVIFGRPYMFLASYLIDTHKMLQTDDTPMSQLIAEKGLWSHNGGLVHPHGRYLHASDHRAHD